MEINNTDLQSVWLKDIQADSIRVIRTGVVTEEGDVMVYDFERAGELKTSSLLKMSAKEFETLANYAGYYQQEF